MNFAKDFHPKDKPKGFCKNVLNQTRCQTEELLKICLNNKISNHNALDIFGQLSVFTNKLTKIQKDYCLVKRLFCAGYNRQRQLDNLVSRTLSVITKQFHISCFNAFGFGLAASIPLKSGTPILRIPRKCFFDSSKCGPKIKYFIANDPLASKMENVALCLSLLSELSTFTDSPWFDYIASLQPEYTTFLYLSSEDLHHIKGSPTLKQVVSNYLCICRQYCYFFDQFERTPEFRSSMNSVFCFDDYRWVVSTVMSRSNQIPVIDKVEKMLCLIPVWDIINHKRGQVTTDYDPETGELIFYTMESYEVDDQIFMDYGTRTTEEFFMFSGFVPSDNPHNLITITLGVSNSDRLGSKRRELMQLMGLDIPLTARVSGDLSSMMELFMFGRIFSMDEAELDSTLSNATKCRDPVKRQLSSLKFDLSQIVDQKAITFLINRFQLLITGYGQLVEQETEELKSLPIMRQLCENLKCEDVKILKKGLESLNQVKNMEYHLKNEPISLALS